MKSIFKNDLRNHATIGDQITENIRNQILRGDLRPEGSLKQDLLAQQFGVSVGIIREALKNLEGEGLLEFIPNKGAHIRSLSSREALDIFDLRLLLESEALYRSLPSLGEEDFFILEGMLDEEEFCFDPVLYNTLNCQYHMQLYKYCGNAKLLDTIRELNDSVARYMIMYLAELKQKDVSQNEHRQLLEACRAKDKRGAKTILKKHMQSAGKALAAYLKKTEKSEK